MSDFQKSTMPTSCDFIMRILGSYQTLLFNFIAPRKPQHSVDFENIFQNAMCRQFVCPYSFWKAENLSNSS
jgi:hypothetical protein